MDPQRSHFCEQLGGERLPKKRGEMRGEKRSGRRGRRGGLLKTMQRITEHTGPGLAPGNVDECVCVCVCVSAECMCAWWSISGLTVGLGWQNFRN